MPEGAFQRRMENYRAVVELTASDRHAATADDDTEPTTPGTVISLLDRLFDGSLGQSGLAA
jgi:hypothetical protein